MGKNIRYYFFKKKKMEEVGEGIANHSFLWSSRFCLGQQLGNMVLPGGERKDWASAKGMLFISLFSSCDIWIYVPYKGNPLVDSFCPFSGCQLASHSFSVKTRGRACVSFQHKQEAVCTWYPPTLIAYV